MQRQTPPVALGLTSRRVKLPTGVELHYVEKGDPTGSALNFLHGFADSWRSWQLNLPLVSDQYHTFALSQRGHGDSEKPECCYRPDDLANDVIAFMDALNIRRSTLIGHSMGSFIAYTVALNQPERLERLVLLGWGPLKPTDEAGAARVMELHSYLNTLKGSIEPAFVRDFVARTAFNPIPAAYTDTLVIESLKVPVTVWKQLVAGRLASVEDTASGQDIIKTPTLIMYGDRDPYAREGTSALTSVIQNQTVILFPSTGHALHWEHPQRFVKELQSFLRAPHDTQPSG